MDDKKVFLVKCKSDIDNSATGKILKYAEKSLKEKEKGYYNPTESETITYDTNKNYIMIVSYKGNGDVCFKSNGNLKSDIQSIYIGTANLVESKRKGKYNIEYYMKKYIDNPYVIANLLDDIDFKIDSDYGRGSYVRVLHVESLIKKIKELLITSQEKEDNDEKNDEKYNCYKLSKFAQHDNQSIRLSNEQKPQNDRSEFQRDRERIVNSRSFRRLVDKAQIFSAEKGDHYRTRMTHTLEVNQIAKAIAMALNLNLDLTEAIALGHDIGHTPFGHQGERTLKDILTDNIAENFHIKNIDSTVKNILGGFKHNIQSVRVLSKIEEKYVGCSGLDVSVQVLEGILKHTKVKDVDLSVLLDENLLQYLDREQPFSNTLEGQVVAIADEIAQRGHDLDDAISSGLITSAELLSSLDIDKFKDLYMQLSEEKEKVEDYQRIYVNEQELLASRFVSIIIGYFIKDVIKTTQERLSNSVENDKGVITKRIVDLSDDGNTICKYLEKVVNKRVINNSQTKDESTCIYPQQVLS